MLKQNHFTYQITRCELLTKDISRIFLQAPIDHRISYRAGQYIKILHPDQSISPMSIACAPQDITTIELHLHHPQENLQAIDLLRLIKTGNPLVLRGPYGVCTTEKLDLNHPIIFMANGTGFAPIKAIMEELINVKYLPRIHFYWSGASSEELYMQPLVQEWMMQIKQFKFTPVIASPVLPVILHDYSDLSLHQVYAVDMEGVVYQALSVFMERGLAKEKFYSDVFGYHPEE